MTREQRQAELRQLFATPVALAVLPEAGRLNAALAEAILQREASQPTTRHSNLGGWQSTWDLLEWGGPAAAEVIGAGKALANKLTGDREGRPRAVAWKVNAWANVNRSGQANEFHTHPGAYWSGSYYVDDGGIAEDPALGGEFEVQDPRGVGPAMYAPELAFAMPGGRSVGASELLRPKSGMLILFPSWLSHAVRPYHGSRARISIAFNFSL